MICNAPRALQHPARCPPPAARLPLRLAPRARGYRHGAPTETKWREQTVSGTGAAQATW